MKKLQSFLLSLFSRRILLWITQKILFVFVFITLTDQYWMVALYAINTIFDLFILNELNVKPADAKINIGIGNKTE